MNRLDAALGGLLGALDGGSSRAMERVEVLEALVATLQAARMAAAAAAAAAREKQAPPPEAAAPPAAAQEAPAQQAAMTPPQEAAAAAGSAAAAAAGKRLTERAAEVSLALRLAAEAMKVSAPAGGPDGGAAAAKGAPSGGRSALPLLAALVPAVEAAAAQLGPALAAPIVQRSDLSPQQSVNPSHGEEVQFKTPAVEVGEEAEAAHPGWGERIKEAVGSVLWTGHKVTSGARAAAESARHAASATAGQAAEGVDRAQKAAEAAAQAAAERGREAVTAAGEKATIAAADMRQATRDVYHQAAEAVETARAHSQKAATAGDKTEF
ncbi:hypothetical protein GPECTOR_82g263 [Gonium pectorale]|uniref:Uncharacterized protein n=1 Tax=Gonium pectorale TaxID=33097 RepID=A0A150G1I1_GONPE|nr:hypothetical protein GPECTOR_82g263 [Gonium pectorale]|eukprot:KXZ43729.1 hypothetical protein GPECTOR_82g263 [Gonium pectorale]